MRSTIGSLYKAYGWDVHDWLKLLVEPMVQFHGQFWTTAKGYGFKPRGPTEFAKSADKSFLSRLLFEHGWWDHNRPSQRKQSGAATFRAHISSGNATYGSVSMTIIPLGKRVVNKAKWNPATSRIIIPTSCNFARWEVRANPGARRRLRPPEIPLTTSPDPPHQAVHPTRQQHGWEGVMGGPC